MTSINRAAVWNTYSSRNIRYHCPKSGTEFVGSGTHCPDCHTNLSHRSHWKWYSPDEPRPSPWGDAA